MADIFQFDLVSPERSLASLDVTEVQIPGAEGDMTAMAHHAPIITTLRPGVLTATGPSGSSEFVVSGGFAEIGEHGISVLAEQAIPKGDMTSEVLKGLIDAATDAFAKAQEANVAHVDDVAKTLADMVAIGDQIGMSVNS